MEFVGDLIGILGALVDALGIPGMALVGVFALIFYWTRKRPGRRYDRPPRPVAESQESWWFTG
jgi:hypothetical protein